MTRIDTGSLARFALAFSAAALVALGTALPSLADGQPGVVLTGGSLTGGTSLLADFTGITMDGTAKTATATWVIANIVDATGSGAGWKDSITLTQLKEYAAGAYVTSGKTLATSSITVTTVPVVAGLSGSDSTTGITPIVAGTALDTGSGVKLASAATDSGMGSYTVSSVGVTLSVPANAYAKTYKTDATISAVTAP